MRLPTSFTRTLCAAIVATLALLLPLKPALAADYTDLWVTAGEDAWGVNFVQWGSIIYATFYIYGPDNKPVWYSAVLNCDGSGNFSGTLFSMRGTYFALPWNPTTSSSQRAPARRLFSPSTVNNYQGTLTYTVNGVRHANQAGAALQRPSLPSRWRAPISARYPVAYSGCTGATDSIFVDTFR